LHGVSPRLKTAAGRPPEPLPAARGAPGPSPRPRRQDQGPFRSRRASYRGRQEILRDHEGGTDLGGRVGENGGSW
jgi:ribosomal protein L34